MTKAWRKLKPIFESPDISNFWRGQLWDMLEETAINYKFLPRLDSILNDTLSRPKDLDSCDWRCDLVGRQPKWHDYVIHGGSHYMAPVNLEVITRLEPGEDWCLLKSWAHSACWNRRRNLLFDPQFNAIGIPAQDAFDLATGEQMACNKRRTERAEADKWNAEWQTNAAIAKAKWSASETSRLQRAG